MRIKKSYHFYAAHRNQFLDGKCERLHGHVYRLGCIFNATRNSDSLVNGAVTQLFESFDSKIEPMLKQYFDHRTMWDVVSGEASLTGPAHQIHLPEHWLTPFPFPTSVENVSLMLFYIIKELLLLDLVELHLQETESSTVIYTVEDYDREHLVFGRRADWMSQHPFWKSLYQ